MSVGNAIYNSLASVATAVKINTASAALAVANYLNPSINTVAQNTLAAAYKQGTVVGQQKGEALGYQKGFTAGQEGVVSKTKAALICIATAVLTVGITQNIIFSNCYCRC